MIKKVGPILCIFLSALNASASSQNDLKAVRPQDVLPDAQNESNGVRKGTIKALIDNIAALNKLFQMPESKDRNQKIEEVNLVIKELGLGLYKVEVFTLFSINEWLQNPHNPGRIFATLACLEVLFSNFTMDMKQKVMEQLKEIQNSIKEPLILSKISALQSKYPSA